MVDKSIAEAIVNSAVKEGVINAAASSGNDLKSADIASVQKEVLKQVEPAVQHITSTEKWWQSRTVVGQIIGFICMVAGPIIGMEVSAEDQAQVTGAIVALGGVINVGMTLWSRYVAKKPLFSN